LTGDLEREVVILPGRHKHGHRYGTTGGDGVGALAEELTHADTRRAATSTPGRLALRVARDVSPKAERALAVAVETLVVIREAVEAYADGTAPWRGKADHRCRRTRRADERSLLTDVTHGRSNVGPAERFVPGGDRGDGKSEEREESDREKELHPLTVPAGDGHRVVLVSQAGEELRRVSPSVGA
jgi:hypothetical protein